MSINDWVYPTDKIMPSSAVPLATRLSALAHPNAATFGATDPTAADAVALASWLEDRFIRQQPPEERGPLRQGEPAALRAYLEELGSPAWVDAHERAGRYAPVCSWLVNLALQYEYGDNLDAHEAAATAALAAAQPPLLAHDDAELLALAAALKVTPSQDPVATLQAALKAARQRPRPPPVPAPAPKRAAPAPGSSCSAPSSASAGRCSSAAGRPKGAQAPLEGLSDGTFPLGFATGSEAVDDAARVLRMLHVRALRQLQDSVNATIAGMQEFTANPKTDGNLGRVGR